MANDFGKPIPCPRGVYLVPSGLPRRAVKARVPTPEERAASKRASEQAASAAATLHVELLAQGMADWLERAHQKWLRAGGYGCALTPEEQAEIRAAGFVPAPRDH
jgi:hypothetical protein